MTNLNGPTIQQLKQMGLLDNVNSLYGKTATQHVVIFDEVHAFSDNWITSSAKDDMPTDKNGRRFTVFYVDEVHGVPEDSIRPGDLISIAGEVDKYVAQGAPSHDYVRRNRHERRKWAKLARRT